MPFELARVIAIHNPTARHWKALLPIASCANAPKELGLTFVRGSGLRLSVFAVC